MRIRLHHLFLTAVLLFTALPVPAQLKLYTRKLRLADFPSCTTKVVLDGDSFLELTLREAVTGHWRISPYEFSTPQESIALQDSSRLYFLFLTRDEGLDWLTLTKGGKLDEKESFRQPFDVVRLPIASTGNPSGRELDLMGAFLDIIQAFVQQAMDSDKTAYGGLSADTRTRLRGKTVLLAPDAADAAFLAREKDRAVPFCVAPASPEEGYFCYKMLISADTHELLFYKKYRYRTPDDARFSEDDVRRFRRLGATVVTD